MFNEKYNTDKLFRDFGKLRVLIIGDVMIDNYVWGKVERISPEAPVPVVTVTNNENRLGGAANVALNVHVLGAVPVLCSVMGNDITGNFFTELMKQQGISDAGIIKSNNRITTLKKRIIGNKSQMLRVDEETKDDILPHETELLFQRITKLIQNDKTDVIIFEDYDKGVITPMLIKEITNVAEKFSIPVAVDPKKKNFLEYQNITLFKPNFRELKEGVKSDMETGNIDELKKTVELFRQKYNIQLVMVTLSEMGIFVNSDSVSKIIPAHIRNIADVSGAGDTVIATASLCLALGLPHEQIAAISNLAGGLVCEKTGVVPVDKKQLADELNNKSESPI